MAAKKEKTQLPLSNITLVATLLVTEAKLAELGGRNFKKELGEALTTIHERLKDDVVLRVRKDLGI